MAAELPIDDEVPRENMPAEGTAKVARLVAMAKGFLPECRCRVQDFPSEPGMACMKLSCFLACWFSEKLPSLKQGSFLGKHIPI